MIDPFASAIENTQPPAPTYTEPPAQTPLPNSQGDGGVVVTFKDGFPWVVVHGESVDGALAITKNPNFKELLDRTKAIAQAYAGDAAKGRGNTSAPPAANNSTAGNGGGRSDLPPTVQGDVTCDHGQRVYKNGNGARGPWAALFCSAPAGTPDHEKCSPAWRQKDGTFKVG